jgi:cadmium resistance protein CadD (predicted permease)
VNHLILPGIDNLLNTVVSAITAFFATNLDDIFLLLLFFSRVDQRLKVGHVVAGQFLGFSVLVAVSLVGFWGGTMLPGPWIGLLGLLPISLGISQLIERLEAAPTESEELSSNSPWGKLEGWPLAEVIGVASVTMANGSDNISVYMPLMAHENSGQLLITLIIFGLLMGIWCLVAWKLTQAPILAQLLKQNGSQLIPVVLIGLGVLILVDSHTLEQRGLAVFAISCVGLMLLSLTRQLGELLQPGMALLRSR